jgi:hypothetical protein
MELFQAKCHLTQQQWILCSSAVVAIERMGAGWKESRAGSVAETGGIKARIISENKEQ